MTVFPQGVLYLHSHTSLLKVCSPRYNEQIKVILTPLQGASHSLQVASF